MPKIRDLGISTIPFARSEDGVHGYWMCNPSPGDPEGAPEEKCHPTPPKCHPTNTQPQCNPTQAPPPGEKEGDDQSRNTGGLPAHAIVALRQQLQQQIGSQLHI